MAGISLSGLASGMDWKSIVTQLMALEKAPQDKAKAKVSSLATRQTALDNVKTSLLALQTSAKALSFGTGTSSPRSAKLLGTSTEATVATADGAALGTFQIAVGGSNLGATDTAGAAALASNTGMPTNSVLYGAKSVIKDPSAMLSMKLSDYGVTAGTFTIADQVITITSTDLSQTVQSFFSGLTQGGSIGGNLAGVTFNTTPNVSVPFLGVSQDATTGALTLTAPASNLPQSIGAPADTSNILSAMGFFKGQSPITNDAGGGAGLTMVQTIPSAVLGLLKVGTSALATATAGATDQYLIINGVQVGAFTQASTLNSIISAINVSSAGVTASIDAASQRLVLTSNTSGTSPIHIDTTTTVGGVVQTALPAQLGLITGATEWGEWNSETNLRAAGTGGFVRGTPLAFTLKYNGHYVRDSSGSSLLYSDSNVVDLSRYGFGGTKITLNPSTDITNLTTPQTYTAVVSGNQSAARAKIETFISSYNSLRQTVEDNTKITVGSDGKVTTSVLSDNKEIANLANTLRSKVFAAISDATNTNINSSYNSISKIGLGFDKTGVLSITNSTLLDAALTNAPTAVDQLLNAVGTSTTATTTQGIGARISNYADTLTGTSGLFPSLTSSISAQTKRLQKQIDDLTRSLTARQKTLENSFIAMERAQSQIQSQSQALTNAFNNNSSK